MQLNRHAGYHGKMHATEEILRRSTIFRRLTPEDRQRLAAVATVREFPKGDTLFIEGDASDLL